MARKGKWTSVRTSPAFLAAGVGAAVCLSASEASATSGTKGPVVGSGSSAVLFGGQVHIKNLGSNNLKVSLHTAGVRATRTSGKLVIFEGGYSLKSNSWWQKANVDAAVGNTPARYIGIRFVSAGELHYGWSRFWTEEGTGGRTFHFGEWSYNDTAYYPIRTLGESIRASRLTLSGGKAFLHFVNANEEGVASYAIEVEKDGGWEKVIGFAPGDGHYSFEAGAGAAHRLVTEWVDGTISLVAF